MLVIVEAPTVAQDSPTCLVDADAYRPVGPFSDLLLVHIIAWGTITEARNAWDILRDAMHARLDEEEHTSYTSQ